MLAKNIHALRQAKGLTQNDLAIKLNVVRQTVSKWERGLSVPDAQLLIELADALDTTVPTLLGEDLDLPKADELKTIGEQLALINAQLAKRQHVRKQIINGLTLFLMVLIIIVGILLFNDHSSYLSWDSSDPTTAVLAVGFHSLEWIFVRIAPLVLIALLIILILNNRHH